MKSWISTNKYESYKIPLQPQSTRNLRYALNPNLESGRRPQVPVKFSSYTDAIYSQGLVPVKPTQLASISPQTNEFQIKGSHSKITMTPLSDLPIPLTFKDDMVELIQLDQDDPAYTAMLPMLGDKSNKYFPQNINDPFLNALEHLIATKLGRPFDKVICTRPLIRRVENAGYLSHFHLDFDDLENALGYEGSRLKESFKRKQIEFTNNPDDFKFEMLNAWGPIQLSPVQNTPLAFVKPNKNGAPFPMDSSHGGSPMLVVGSELELLYAPNMVFGDLLLFNPFYIPHAAVHRKSAESDRTSIESRCFFLN